MSVKSRLSSPWFTAVQFVACVFPERTDSSVVSELLTGRRVHCRKTTTRIYRDVPCELLAHRGQELCESRGARPGLSVPDSPCGLCRLKATMEEERGSTGLRSRVKVEMAILGHLIVRTVSVDVKQH